MTSDLRIQGEVVVNSEQAENAFNRVGDKATQMANEVATSAGKAGQAVDKIGDGAGASAEKFTRAESRISASIKRATTELELLGKTASQRLEFNIADKGLDAAKFEPALKKLRELEAQALQAQRAATGSLDKMGLSAKQTAAALRGVPAQFTDIITSLQGGQAPLTVFLQQGGQIKDMFGGAGNAARALGGYVLGLVNPFTVAAAAAAALAYAYNQGSKEADAYNKALITTGNAAGTNAAQLKAYAQEISAVVGTQGKAAESLAALASTGKIGAESLKEAAQAAVQYERATGQAVSKTAEQFASLRNEPLAAVLKLNDGMNFLTDSTYKQIKSLEEQGRTAEAANVAQRAFADTLSSRAGEMERNLGSVERGWLKVKDAAKGAWDAILNVGRASTSVDQLAEVRRKIAERENQIANAGFASNGGGAAFGRPSIASTERLRAELAGLQAQAAALEGVAYASRTAAEEERKRGEAVKAAADFDKAGEKFLTDKIKMERELAAARVQGAAAGKSQAEIEQRLAQIRESYAKKGASNTAAENKELRDQMRVLADLAGVSSTYYTELANYQKQREQGFISEKQYVGLVEDLIQKQPFAVAMAKEQADATKAQAKASEEAARAHIKYVESFAKGANAAQQQADQLRTEEAAAAIAADGYYSLAQAIELVTIARLEEQQQGLLGNEDAYLAVQKEIDARKELLQLIGAKEARKAAEESAKDAAREWERSARDIERALTDSLLRGFESGKGFAKNFVDTMKNLFSTLVLRPIISAIVSPVAGAITGALGLSGTANAATGAAGGIGGLLNAGSSLYNAVTNGVSGSISAAFSKFATSDIGARIGLSTATDFGTGYAANIPTPAASNIGAGLGMLGSGLAGYGISSAISNGYTTGGNTVNVLSGIASAFFGPVAGVVGGLINRAFGRKLKDSGIEGTLGGEAGFEGRGFDFYKGGWLRSDKTKYKDLDPTVSGGLSDAFKSIQAQVGTFATVLGLNADKVASFTTDIKVSFKGLDEAGIQKALQDALATGSNELAEQVLGTWTSVTKEVTEVIQSGDWGDGTMQTVTRTIEETTYTASEYAREGEKAIDTLTRLATSLSTVNDIWKNLGNTVYEASLAGADAASRIADAFGGLEAMAATTGTYFQNFYSPQEQRAAVERQLNDALGKLNLTLPDIDATNAREQYRMLAEAQDRSTDEGLKAYVMLLQLSGAFASITAAAEDATAALKAQQDAAYDLFRRAVDRDRSALQDQASALRDSIGAIADAVDMLRGNASELYNTVSTTAQMQAAQGMVYVEQALAGVQAGGSVTDYTGLQDAISAARGGIDSGVYATQFERERDALVLAGQLTTLADVSDLQLSVEERQLKAINEQLEYLDTLSKRAEEMVNGTAALTETVDTYFARLMGILDPEQPEGTPGKPAGISGATWGGSGAGGGNSSYVIEQLTSVVDPATGTRTYSDGSSAQMTPEELWAWQLMQKPGWIPSYDIGTNRVPRDMLAMVHKDEAIVPKAFNPWANGQAMNSGDPALLAEMRAMRAELAALRAASQATANNTAAMPQMADQFDTVTNGGNAMRAKALA